MTADFDDEETGRWIEPELFDLVEFRRDHPETVASPELFERLERRIARLAASFEHNPADREDVRAAIRLRIIEAATGSRATDGGGRPIRDYLAQSDSYIVRHAAARAWNELRRERRLSARSVCFESLAAAVWAEEDAAIDPPIAGPEFDSDSQISATEIEAAVIEVVSPAERRVFLMLSGGLDRAEIARRLGLDRRTVSDHVAAIRRATLSVLTQRMDQELLRDVAARSTYRRREKSFA